MREKFRYVLARAVVDEAAVSKALTGQTGVKRVKRDEGDSGKATSAVNSPFTGRSLETALVEKLAELFGEFGAVEAKTNLLVLRWTRVKNKESRAQELHAFIVLRVARNAADNVGKVLDHTVRVALHAPNASHREQPEIECRFDKLAVSGSSRLARRAIERVWKIEPQSLMSSSFLAY